MPKLENSYQVRMYTSCPQFRYFGIDPVWEPGTGDIEGFCTDEVVRQGHDPRVRDDGGNRVKWMLNAWAYAQAIEPLHDPELQDIINLGSCVEEKVNAGGFRRVDVYIGNRMGVSPDWLHEYTNRLVEMLPVAPEAYLVGVDKPGAAFEETFKTDVRRVRTADDWYLMYEGIHPFADGNGRSGKILNNWLLGTLDDPELVHDYFGGGNP